MAKNSPVAGKTGDAPGLRRLALPMALLGLWGVVSLVTLLFLAAAQQDRHARDASRGVAEALLEQTRHDLLSAATAPSLPPESHIQGLALPDVGDGPWSGLILLEERPALAVAWHEDGALRIHSQPLDGDLLQVLGERFGLGQFHAITAGESDPIPPEETALPLRTHDGTLIGYLLWDAPQPGRLLLVDALVPVLGVLLIMAVLGGTAFRRLQQHARLLAESEAAQRQEASQKEYLRSLLIDAVESVDEGFVLFDDQARLRVVNERYRRAYPAVADLLVPGTSFEEILATAATRQGVDGQTDPEGLKNWLDHRLNRHLDSEGPVECILSDGGWYRISERPTRSGGIVKVISDITAIKQHEQELAQQSDMLQATFDAMAQGVAVFDRDGVAVAWNEQFAPRMGYPTALMQAGITAGHLVAYDQEERGLKPPPLSADTGALNSQLLPVELVLPDGRSIEVRANPMPRGGHVVTVSDISDRRQAEKALQHSQKMDAVGQLAGGIAHEFNNMLTSIGGFARMARRDSGSGERVEMCLDEITRASDRAADLTRQLLDFSRRTSTDNPHPLNLKSMVKELSTFLRPLLGERHPVALDLTEEDLTVMADPSRLHQALVNLCINARDAMAEGGMVRISTARFFADDGFAKRHPSLAGRSFAAITVRDCGHGIDPAIGDRIFEPFFTTKPQGKGTGLGLPMVYSMAEQIGGTVEFESTLGRGTAFTLTLPLAPSTSAEDVEERLSALPRATTPATILLVEDEDSVRRLLTLTLEEVGYQVVEALDGDEALERFAEWDGEIDVVLTDVVMPGLGGGALVDTLHKAAPNLRVIFMSGYCSEEEWAKQHHHHNSPFLAKPIEPLRLLKTLEDVLNSDASPKDVPLL